jgi:hypothetical protein
MVKAMVSAAALLLAACETSGGGYAAPQRQMGPNARAMMFMYGMQQLQQSMQPPAMPVHQGFICRPYPGGAIQCQ